MSIRTKIRYHILTPVEAKALEEKEDFDILTRIRGYASINEFCRKNEYHHMRVKKAIKRKQVTLINIRPKKRDSNE